MLVSPTEPTRLRKLGKVSSLPETYGCDFLFIDHAKRTGVQRKEFPADFMASLNDGRMYELVREMMELDRGILIIEGYGRWTEDGALEKDYGRGLTKQDFYKLIYTLSFEWGIEVFQNGGMDETAGMLMAMEEWAAKKKHVSLDTRPGVRGDGWGQVKERDAAVHVLQSWNGVGPDVGGKVYDHFGRLPLKWTVSKGEMLEVGGVGKVTVEKFGKLVEFDE